MHTLSIFPELLSYSFYAPLFLRIVVGLYLLYLGKKRLNNIYKWSAVFYFLSGLFVFLGLYTQITAIVAVAVLKFDFYFDYWRNRQNAPVDTEKYFIYFMAGVILLSLLVTGPGPFAFDIPL